MRELYVTEKVREYEEIKFYKVNTSSYSPCNGSGTVIECQQIIQIKQDQQEINESSQIYKQYLKN